MSASYDRSFGVLDEEMSELLSRILHVDRIGTGTQVKTPERPASTLFDDAAHLRAMNLDYHPILGRDKRLVSAIKAALEPHTQAPRTQLPGAYDDFPGLLFLRRGKARALVEQDGRRTELWRFRSGCWLGIPLLFLHYQRDQSGAGWTDLLEGFEVPAFTIELMEQSDSVDEDLAFDLLPRAACFALMDAHPVFRQWVENQMLLGLVRARELSALMAENPVLGSLKQEDRALMLQLSVLRQNHPRDDDEAGPPYLDGSADSKHRIALMTCGAAHYYALGANGPGPYIGEARRSELVGLGGIVQSSEVERMRPPTPREPPMPLKAKERRTLWRRPLAEHGTLAWLSPDAEILEWNRRSLRWVMSSRPDTWLPAVRYLAPGAHPGAEHLATLSVMCSAQPGLGLSTMALGTAAALSRNGYDEAFDAYLQGAKRETWLVLVALSKDLVPQDDWLWKLRDDPAATVFTLADGHQIELLDISLTESKTARISGLPSDTIFEMHAPQEASFRLVWVDDLLEAEVFINAMRTRPLVGDVVAVVHQAWDERARDYMEHLIQPDTRVIWLHDDPGNERGLLEHMWAEATTAHVSAGLPGLPKVLPQTLLRVDRLTPDYIRRAGEVDEHDLPGEVAAIVQERKAYPWRHIARVQDDSEGAALVQQLRLDEVLNRHQELNLGESFWRLKRMIRNKTIGLALGGGGVYGCAHMALLQELDAHDIPVDYIAGASFGSVVGGLFTAGGFDALEKYLELNPTPPDWLGTSPLASLWGAMKSRTYHALLVTMAYDSIAAEQHLNKVIASATDRPGSGWVACTTIPFLPVGTDIFNRTLAVARSGNVGWATRVSACLPPAYPAIIRERGLYVDGAILANVPANELRYTGADFVIAANVVPPVGMVEAATMSQAGETPTVKDTGKRVHRVATGLIRLVGGKDMPPLQTLTSRVADTIASGWLALWKIGVDQGLNASDYVLDMWTLDVSMGSTWWSDRIREQTREKLREEKVAEAIRERWHAKTAGHEGSAVYSLIKQDR
ncbi:MAG: patatin-like phospholipase family protein [Proteobacteria bacterium]|nr:patatin-like phospholipase family protein [Pseudomonadota bacterium]